MKLDELRQSLREGTTTPTKKRGASKEPLSPAERRDAAIRGAESVGKTVASWETKPLTVSSARAEDDTYRGAGPDDFGGSDY